MIKGEFFCYDSMQGKKKKELHVSPQIMRLSNKKASYLVKFCFPMNMQKDDYK